MLDVREMLRRLRLGESARAVAKGLGVSRNTVKREYGSWFEVQGLLPEDAASLPSGAELLERLAQRATAMSSPPRLMACREEIAAMLQEPEPLQVKVAWQRFSTAPPEVGGSYAAFRRFARRYVQQEARRAVLRLEVVPARKRSASGAPIRPQHGSQFCPR